MAIVVRKPPAPTPEIIELRERIRRRIIGALYEVRAGRDELLDADLHGVLSVQFDRAFLLLDEIHRELPKPVSQDLGSGDVTLGATAERPGGALT